jgi:hypothetical membrane protein
MVTTETPIRAGSVRSSRGQRNTKLELILGSIGGPIFVALVLVQMAIVPWFDITRYPLSVLSIGETGYLQKAAFIVAGVLTIVGALGLRRAIRGTPAGRFGPPLVGAFGTGLVLSGLFNVDDDSGAPPGVAIVAKADYTWHMYAHNLSAMLAFICLSLACFVFLRRFALRRATGWAVASGFVGAATFVLFFAPIGTPSLRLAIATLFIFIWTTALFLSVRAASRPTV